ncbi:CvpA family protein [Marinihelvus fidelis]|uniref:CvpA family protein n=1 Tax=Marinihelvus fidelis TaxID=2613842 RepID=A0A5N0TAG7_9GAMM|nr:CvpA family protein [Marinihelvus fidelis]KAA9132063.1 CvpA family protein [Marinihelvus fidelis]
MSPADIFLLAVIGLSLLVGLLRGFVREVFALAVWGLAFLVGYQYAGGVAEWISPQVSLPSMRLALAFGGLFVATLLVGGLVTYLLGQLVDKTGLTGTDRLLGGVFGLVRGVLLVVLLIAVAGFTPLPADPWWPQSRVIQSFLPMAEWAVSFLPENAREYHDFDPTPEASEPAGPGDAPGADEPTTDDAAVSTNAGMAADSRVRIAADDAGPASPG